MNLRTLLPVLASPLFWAAIGCASRTPAPAPPPRAEVAAQGALPGDAQGIELFLSENLGTIARADLASERATGDETRALARELAEAHRGYAERLGDLASRLAIEPVSTEESRLVRAEDERLFEQLSALPLGEFDRAWREAEAAAHERLRQRLDGVLVPAAREPEYRAALLEFRTRVAAHLERLGGPPQAPPGSTRVR